jgi:hypothetical protein
MPKCSLLIASCFLFGSPLTAGPIPTLMITSFTASTSVPLVSFSGSGPSVSIQGLQVGTSHQPLAGGPMGLPIGPLYSLFHRRVRSVSPVRGA